MADNQKELSQIPPCFKAWMSLGFEWVDVMEGYIRISDTEFDQPHSIVILLDGFGAIRSYIIGDKGEQYAFELTAEMGKAIYMTWKWAKVDFATEKK